MTRREPQFAGVSHIVKEISDLDIKDIGDLEQERNAYATFASFIQPKISNGDTERPSQRGGRHLQTCAAGLDFRADMRVDSSHNTRTHSKRSAL